MYNKHEMEDEMKIYLRIILILMCSLFLRPIVINAKNEVEMKDGELIYVTVDRKAKYNRRWRVDGFTIRAKKTDGIPGSGDGKLWIDKNECSETMETSSDGEEVISTFVFPEDIVLERLKKSGIDVEKLKNEGGVFYLNSICAVYDYNPVDGSKTTVQDNIYNMHEIRAWMPNNDFTDHFDIEVTYQPKELPELEPPELPELPEEPDIPEFVQGPEQIVDRMDSNLANPNTSGIIKADARGNELFEVTDGIPTTEDLYVNVFSRDYLHNYLFHKIRSTRKYRVTIERTYHLKWTVLGAADEFGHQEVIPMSETTTVTKYYQIEREYYYWCVVDLNVYGLKNAMVENYALPNGKLNLFPNNYSPPSVNYMKTKNYAKNPNVTTFILSTKTINGGGKRPSIPKEDWQSEAEKKLGQVTVRNDQLEFNGTTYMSSEEVEKETPKPTNLPQASSSKKKNLFYEFDLTIERNKANGKYNSSGEVIYNLIKNIGKSKGSTLQYTIDDLNNVVIHTPVVCNAKVQNNRVDNQMITPDKTMASFVLDRPFYVTLPTTGDHRNILNYGTRDYEKYIEDRQVKFPFDVYLGSIYYQKQTWISIGTETQFYLPIWVDEGKYTIMFRTISINSEKNSGLDRTETLHNNNLHNYVAVDTSQVEISGRLYGMNLFDISDYPLWQAVFRRSNSTAHTNFNYTVGTNNQNGGATGRNPKYTLPLIGGSHPNYLNIGIIKKGYLTRFSLITIGNMYNANDYIRILPKFYYVDYQGQNNKEVDIYYSETFSGKKNSFVKMGSDLDKTNTKTMTLGDPFLNATAAEITSTASIKGISEKQLKGIKKAVYTFKNIMIPESLRTFIASNQNIPSAVSLSKAVKSKQRWYGEYYLPSEVYAVPKDYDVISYGRKNGLTKNDTIWLKNGYIIINFQIETLKNGQRHLSYINPTNSTDGYCNMWKREGFQYQKTDYKANTFYFRDGDFVLYHTNQSAAKDYGSRGTH